MTKKVLITGAAGMVGSELVKNILTTTNKELICLLNAGGKRMQKDEFLKRVFGNSSNYSKYTPRVEVLWGDITYKDLKLNKKSLSLIYTFVTEIIHCAGSTNFSLNLKDSRKLNLEGTKNVFALAEKCKNNVSFGYISTVFVAGKKTGDVFEKIHNSDKGFVNFYEQTKFEAENFLLKKKSSVKISIYRLSTVLGNSKTGEVSKFIAPHQIMRLMYLGMISMIPGEKECLIDLIAVDHAAQTITKLFFENFSPNEIFHIAAGSEGSYRLQDIIDDTFTFFEKNAPGWKEKNIPKPLLVSKDSFDFFLKSIEETKNPFMLQIVHNTKFFAEQLLYSKKYRKDATLKKIPDFNNTLPDIRKFYDKVLKFCLINHWNKIQK